MNKQYIYIFSNTERYDLVKIGKTQYNPRMRANKLSNETGAIGQFIAEWFMEVPDNDLAEKILHFKLKKFHYKKEFYQVKLTQAISTACVELYYFFKEEKPSFFVRKRDIFTEIIEDFNLRVKSLPTVIKYSNESEKEKFTNRIQELKQEITIINKYQDSTNRVEI